MLEADRIRLLRQLRKENQAEFAAALGISQGAVSKMEVGAVTPPDQFFEKLAASTGFLGDFFEKPLPQARPLSLHRSQKSLVALERDYLNAKSFIMTEQIERMMELAQEKLEMSVEPIPVQNKVGAVQAAKIVRTKLGLGTGPIENLTEVLEQKAGLVIVADHFGTMFSDALTVMFENKTPVVFLNKGKGEGDRWNFNIAHELGHQIMHRQIIAADKEVEDQANAFAAEFLMPEEGIKADLSGQVTLQTLAGLKMRWKVSMNALAYRLKDVGGSTGANKSRYLFMQLSRYGYRKQEPISFDQDEPTRLARILREAIKKTGGLEELAAMLYISPQKMRELYPAIKNLG